MQKFTLHTHTIGFDGRDTPADMVACANKLGMHTIGISNHFIVYPGIESTPMFHAALERGYSTMYASSFDMALERFRPHYDELRNIKSDVRILHGMEVDFFPGNAWRDGFDAACDTLCPDYKIGAAHFVEYGGRLCNSYDIKMATPDDQEQMTRIYWENIARAASSGLFNWMAHLDLIKCVDIARDEKWVPLENMALDAISAADIGVEINTKGISAVGEQYPSNRILRGCVGRGIPILVSDDAHRVGDIGRSFDVANDLISQIGIKNMPNVDEILNFA